MRIFSKLSSIRSSPPAAGSLGDRLPRTTPEHWPQTSAVNLGPLSVPEQIFSIKVSPGSWRCQACLRNYTIGTPRSASRVYAMSFRNHMVYCPGKEPHVLFSSDRLKIDQVRASRAFQNAHQ